MDEDAEIARHGSRLAIHPEPPAPELAGEVDEATDFSPSVLGGIAVALPGRLSARTEVLAGESTPFGRFIPRLR